TKNAVLGTSLFPPGAPAERPVRRGFAGAHPLRNLPLGGRKWRKRNRFRFLRRGKGRRGWVWWRWTGAGSRSKPARKKNGTSPPRRRFSGGGRGGAAAGANEHETPPGGSRAARKDAAPRGAVAVGRRASDEFGGAGPCREGERRPGPCPGVGGSFPWVGAARCPPRPWST